MKWIIVVLDTPVTLLFDREEDAVRTMQAYHDVGIQVDLRPVSGHYTAGEVPDGVNAGQRRLIDDSE